MKAFELFLNGFAVKKNDVDKVPIAHVMSHSNTKTSHSSDSFPEPQLKEALSRDNTRTPAVQAHHPVGVSVHVHHSTGYEN